MRRDLRAVKFLLLLGLSSVLPGSAVAGEEWEKLALDDVVSRALGANPMLRASAQSGRR